MQKRILEILFQFALAISQHYSATFLQRLKEDPTAATETKQYQPAAAANTAIAAAQHSILFQLQRQRAVVMTEWPTNSQSVRSSTRDQAKNLQQNTLLNYFIKKYLTKRKANHSYKRSGQQKWSERAQKYLNTKKTDSENEAKRWFFYELKKKKCKQNTDTFVVQSVRFDSVLMRYEIRLWRSTGGQTDANEWVVLAVLL